MILQRRPVLSLASLSAGTMCVEGVGGCLCGSSRLSAPTISFEEDGVPVYKRAIESMEKDETTTLYVNYENLLDFSPELASSVAREYFRCVLVSYTVRL